MKRHLLPLTLCTICLPTLLIAGSNSYDYGSSSNRNIRFNSDGVHKATIGQDLHKPFYQGYNHDNRHLDPCYKVYNNQRAHLGAQPINASKNNTIYCGGRYIDRNYAGQEHIDNTRRGGFFTRVKGFFKSRIIRNDNPYYRNRPRFYR